MSSPKPPKSPVAPADQWSVASLLADPERCYRAVISRDRRFDGRIVLAVSSTGIYCRPSCPTGLRPKRANARFYATAAAAQGAGFRACKRCRPDAAPGSPEWAMGDDLVNRAMRAISAGEIDRLGVDGLADGLSVSLGEGYAMWLRTTISEGLSSTDIAWRIAASSTSRSLAASPRSCTSHP